VIDEARNDYSSQHEAGIRQLKEALALLEAKGGADEDLVRVQFLLTRGIAELQESKVLR
jgi:hypothetical protein